MKTVADHSQRKLSYEEILTNYKLRFAVASRD
jgi:hypothetical protein